MRENSTILNYRQEWPEVYSPCFWMGAFALIQSIFIMSILVQFLFKKITWWRQRLKIETPDIMKQHQEHKITDIKLGISYKACKACCLLIVASHILSVVFLQLQEPRSGCKYPPFVLCEGLQALSWTILSLAVFSFQKTKSAKLPLIFRFWWIFNFLQSATVVVFDLRSILIAHEYIQFQEWIDLFVLVVCPYLFAISARGKTGITFTNCSIIDPLLGPFVGEQAEVKRPCPYGRASILELVTFSWMNPVFAIGYKKPLEKSDVPDVDGKDSAEFLSDSFKKIIDDVERRHGLSTSSIYRAMFLFVRRKAMINAGSAVLSASASYVGPLLINDLVKFLEGERKYGLRRGYILAVTFLSAKVVETLARNQWFFGAQQLGMRLRAALISHIYQGLRLSCSSRQKHTSGEIINYMSVDIQRITNALWYTNYIWMLPIQLSLAVYVLNQNLGIGAWAGLAATLAIMACNIPLTRMEKRLQANILVAKDNRMKAMAEVLRNMKTLKLQAWDMNYLQKLEALRGEEYNWLWRSERLTALTTLMFWGSPAFISSITFASCILMGIPLTAGTVLSALATFRMLQDSIFTLPDLLSVFAQGKVSADRVAKYLEEEQLKYDATIEVPRNETNYDVEIDHGIFCWELETASLGNCYGTLKSASPTLTDVKLKVKRGMKVAIRGMVGSGKSSLLSCILGEMPKLDETVRVSERKAYEKYEKVIQACALTKDLELFANGDLTEIGERGINMSGGQKQRIQIARSVYEDADIYLFDDPFSAVDAHTGSQLFKDCVMGILKDKTVLFVTHQVEFLPDADLILVMQDGKIVQKGKFDDLLQQNLGFEAIVGAHCQAHESVINAESSSRIPLATQKSAHSEDGLNTENETDDQLQGITKQESAQDVSQDISDKGRLTQEEERETGGIGKKFYWAYLRAVHGGALVPVIIATQSFFQIFQVASNYWMACASPPTSATTPMVGLGLLFSVYIALSMGSALCVLARSLLVSLIGLLTSEKFFKNMIHCILRAPMSFFDSTPTGRILNRVTSNDQSVLDLVIANRLGWCVFSIIQILGTISVMSQVAWPIFAIFIPVTVVCFLCQRYYIPTARELARLSQIQKAPILHHFAESLTGASSIRAYGQKDRFRKANLGLADNHSRPWFHNISSMEWLSFRLNMLSNFAFAFYLTLLVSLPEGFINPSIAGLAVTYALNLNSQLASIIWDICNTENKMISVERIMQYSRIPSEAPLIVDHYCPPNSWPEAGTINIRSLEVRYAEHLPSVLRNISCTIPGRKKVLDKCRLGDIVRQSPKKLDSTVVENGENWSVGQRQLFCLGRVLLKRSNVLVLDEATASVDSSTDAIIQETIREEFGNCTVLTIAHRIHTVIDSDLILVFSEAGRIIEYNTPSKLLENQSSEFSRLIKEYSRRSHGFSGTANN
ncbi:hypothetical protein BS78_06G207300 [Paspalum vaginatum]|nr:hypothetical protein BS78_06G207300 [Paspalum vaginatum]